MDTKQHYQGLTKEQVIASRQANGENVLTPPAKASLWSQFLEKFDDPIIRILLVAWALSLIIAGVQCWGPEAKGFSAFLESIGIFFAIILASCVSFFFELKANRAFDILNTVNDDIMVKVIREGVITEVPRKDVVVGDVIILQTGEEVPADGTLQEAISLQINESTLTGEPIISKTVVEEDFDSEATYPSNVVMRGTSVVDGHGIMIVDKVGDATGYGKVYEGSQIENNIQTPLQIQLTGLAGVISKAGYTVAGLTFFGLIIKLFMAQSGLSHEQFDNQTKESQPCNGIPSFADNSGKTGQLNLEGSLDVVLYLRTFVDLSVSCSVTHFVNNHNSMTIYY